MPKRTSTAKITRPRLPAVVYRRRLFRLLDKGRRASVVWVNGPGGSGKTLLVASYLDARSLPCLWYQLDAGDSDIATFFYYLGLAAKGAALRRKTALPLLIREYRQGIPEFTRRYFEALCSRVTPPFVIVLDGYHHLMPDSLFHGMIRDALSAIPEGISVIIISRGTPPPALARLRAYKKIHLIGGEELKFSVSEIRSLFRLGLKKGLESGAATQICRMTMGWAAGLVLLMERIKDRSIAATELDKFKPEELFDYFATELFGKIDAGMQAFLMKTAFLSRVSPDDARAMTGRDDAGEVLASLSRNHFFTEQRSVSDPVYQYHPLFREFLLARAGQTYPHGEVLGVMRRAAELLEKSGQTEDAADLYRTSGEWKGLVRLILFHAGSMVSQGRNRPLQEWLKSLPLEVLNGDPWLLYWMGVCMMPFQLLEGRQYFEKSLALFRKRRDTAGVYLAWSGAVEAVIQEMGDIRRLEAWVARFQEIVEEYGFPPPEVEARVTMRIFTALPWRLDNPAFILWDKKALELMDSDEDAGLRMFTGFYLFSCHVWWAGDYATGGCVLETMGRIAKTHKDLPPLMQIMQKASEALFAFLTGDHGRCAATVAEGMEMSHSSGVRIWDALLLMIGAGSRLCAGDPAGAGEFLGKMAYVLDGGRLFDRFYYHHTSAWRFMMTNDIPRAMAHEKAALDLASKTGFEIAEAQAHFAMTHLMRASGELKTAERHILQCRRIGRRMGSGVVEFMSLLSEAALAFDLKREKAGLLNLETAMALGRANGYVYFCGWNASLVTPLCLKALEEEIETDYVRSLIQRCKLAPEAPPLQLENWPWPIRIYALGRFEIMINNNPLRFAGKVQKKPLDMLKVLIAFGGKDVSEYRIHDALWPEADGDTAHIAFKATLHRLRSLLGGEEVIRLREGRMSLDRHKCWVDAPAFEKMLELAEAGLRDAKPQMRKRSSLRSTQPERSVRLLEMAMDLYCGHFLASDGDKPWSGFLRDRLRRKYLRAANTLGNFWLARGGESSIKKAIEYFERGLEKDGAAEELYQGIMICYQKIGNKAEAARLYTRCRDILSESLGVGPSEKTMRIYNEIKGSP